MNVQAHSSLEPSQKYNQDQMPLMNQGFVMTFLTILRVMEILCSFGLVLEGKTGKGIPESSRLDLIETFLASNFALLDAEDCLMGLNKKYSYRKYVMF